MNVTCGNPSHPNGAGHEATPLPYPGPRGWIEEVRQWWRLRRWGCRCAATRTTDTEEAR